MATWKIENLIVKPQDGDHADVVVAAAWRCFDEQAGHYSQIFGNTAFAKGETFVAYGDLTEEVVLGWIWATDVDKAITEARVARQLADQVNPPAVEKPLPWV